ncbi:MAG: hypothetical protein PHZ23_16030 [Acidiphilium sp.]|nr:hypothetical protein [Acidiphilium sp.]
MDDLDWITLVLASATVFLAFVTWRLARSTTATIAQAERHHIEDRRPFCFIEFTGAYRQSPFGSFVLEGASFKGGAHINFSGEIVNYGNGPAKDVAVYLRDRRGIQETDAWRMTIPVPVCSMIAAAGKLSFNIQISEDDIPKQRLGDRSVPVMGIEMIFNDAYEVVLEYRNVFDNVFSTVHAKGRYRDPHASMNDSAQQTEERIALSIPRLPMPVFEKGRKSCRYFNDFVPDPAALQMAMESSRSPVVPKYGG